MILWSWSESLILLCGNVGCHPLRSSDLLRAVASNKLLHILVLRILSLQNDKRRSTVTRKLWESCQKVDDFLHLQIPFTNDAKSRCFYLKVKILWLYQCVSLVSWSLEDLVQTNKDTFDYLVGVFVLNEEKPSFEEDAFSQEVHNDWCLKERIWWWSQLQNFKLVLEILIFCTIVNHNHMSDTCFKCFTDILLVHKEVWCCQKQILHQSCKQVIVSRET